MQAIKLGRLKGFAKMGLVIIVLIIMLYSIRFVISQTGWRVSTNKQHYYPGQDIYVFISGEPNTEFTVRIYNPNGLVYERTDVTNDKGYSYLYLDGFSELGRYVIEMNVGYVLTTNFDVKPIGETTTSSTTTTVQKEEILTTTPTSQKYLDGLDVTGIPKTETIITKRFNLSSYDTKIELVDYHTSPVSQRITYRVFNKRNKDYSYVAIATSGKLRRFRAYHLLNKTVDVTIENITYYEGNVTNLHKNAPILDYIPLQIVKLDDGTELVGGNKTKVGYPYNKTVIRTIEENDECVLIFKSYDFMNKWKNGYFDDIRSSLTKLNVNTNLEVLDSSILPNPDEMVYVYKVPHRPNTWEYFEYETSNHPSKFLTFDPAGGSWWNSSWNYRKQINITNNNDTSILQRGYSINLTFDHASLVSEGKSLADGSDIRITWYNATADEEIELDRVNETAFNTSSTEIWFKLQENISAGGWDGNYTLYYDNPLADEPPTNRSNVYLFWDDFENYTVGSTASPPWTIVAGSWDVQDFGGSRRYRIYGGTESKVYRDTSYTGGRIIEANVYDDYPSSNTPHVGILITWQDVDNDDGIYFRDATDELCHSVRRDGSSSYQVITSMTINSQQWYSLKAVLLGMSADIYVDDIYRGTRTILDSNSVGGVGLWAWSGGEVGYYDNFKVRKYMEPEPTASLLGEEYGALLNATIDLPQQNSVKTRLQAFMMNGTVNCTRGDCDTVNAWAQYLATQTPTIEWTETSYSDFSSYNESVNISIIDGKFRLETTNTPEWWDDDWLYREKFNITENSGQSLTDFQVQINLNSSNVGPHFDWVLDENATRFIWYNESANQNINLSYWTESWNSSQQNATIWVKIPTIPANGNTTIYMYYGNPSAESESNPGSTFDYYDDFDSYTGWSGDTDEFDVTTLEGEGVLYVKSTATGYPGYIYKSLSSSLTNYTVECKVRDEQDTSNNPHPGVIIAGPDSNNWNAFYFRASSDLVVGSTTIGGSNSFGTPAESYTINGATWYDMKAIVVDGVLKNLTIDGNPLSDFENWDVNDGLGIAGFIHYGGSDGPGYFDKLKIKKYVSVEPTITNDTEEELNFKPSGYYISNSYDTGSNDVQYQNIYWSSQGNENTTIKVYTRTSTDNSTWGDWFQEANNSNVDAQPARYIQYKVELSTDNNQQTPYFYENTIQYKVVTSGFANMSSSGTALTTSNPFDCGNLNQTNPTCYPSWSVTPQQVGNYSVRIYAGSPVNATSEIRNITVMKTTYVTDFTVNQSLVGKGRSVELTARLLDDLSEPMVDYNLTFKDETDNYFIGWDLTNSSGYASIVYQIPSDASNGTHTLNASYAGSSEEFLNPSNDIKTLQVSSVPQITDISTTPQTVGFGYNVTIEANVTDEVGVDTVLVNITYPTGTSQSFEMTNVHDSVYQYNFSDTWNLGDHDYYIFANNTDGIENTSDIQQFYVNATVRMDVTTEKEEYKVDEDVYISSYWDDWWNSSWNYRKQINIQENSGTTMKEYPLQFTIDTEDLISENKLQPDCSDMRFVFERDIYELPITINNTGYEARENETIKIVITNLTIVSKIKGTNEIRLFSSPQENPYGVENGIPFWVYELGDYSLTIWAKIPYIPADGQTTVYMYYGNINAADVSNYTDVFTEVVGEAGNVTIDPSWITVNFGTSFLETPVVIASMMTNNQGGSGTTEAAVARIKDLNNESFDIGVEEYPLGDNNHAEEDFGWIALKKGTWIIGGLKTDVGTDTTLSGREVYKVFNFNTTFDAVPIVLTQINSYNEIDRGSHTRVTNPTVNSFQVKIEEQNNSLPHTSETVGYIAIESGKAEGGFTMEARKTSTAVSHNWYSITFSADFSTRPEIIGKFMSEYGGDNMAERMDNATSSGFEVHVEETPVFDGNHVKEVFGWIAVSEGEIYGIEYKPQPSTSLESERVTGKLHQKLPYFLESGCNSNETKVWVQIPLLLSNEQTTIYMYYNNSEASSESDETNVFSYSTTKPIYYPVGTNNVDDADVVSFRDNNTIEAGSTTLIIDQQKLDLLPSADLNQNTPINVMKPVQIESRSTGDAFVPISYAGKEFVYPAPRGTNTYYIYAPFDDAFVQIFNGTELVNTENLTVSSGGTNQTTIDIGDNGTIMPGNISTVYIKSTQPILVFHQAGSIDNFALYPIAEDWWGVASNYMIISAKENDTNVTIYWSDGSSSSQILDSGDYWYVSGGSGSQGMDRAAHVIANDSIGVVQVADGDGGDATTFLPESELGKEHYIPQTAQYIAVVATEPDTNCTLYYGNGTVESQISGSNQRPYPNKIYFGLSSNGDHIPVNSTHGHRLSCNATVYVYYEYSLTNDEHNLWSVKANRQYTYPEPTYTFGYEDTRYTGIKNFGSTSIKGYLWMIVQKKVGDDWQNMMPPVVNDRSTEIIRTIDPEEVLNISQIWEDAGGWNTDEEELGTYRIYAALQDPNGNILVSSVYDDIEDTSEFEIIQAILKLTELKHENEYEHSINEYEVGDRIDWINVTVTAINNTALDANITLNLLEDGQKVSWGPNETKQCGDIAEGNTCEKTWDNQTLGYPIPLDATSGDYTFHWNVTMMLTNGNTTFNNSLSFTIHNIPNTFNSTLNPTRIYKPGWSWYNFTFNNTWTSSISGVNVTINCPNVVGLDCDCKYNGQSGRTCYLGSISSGSQINVPFNVSVDDTTPIGDYNINVTVNYTNPGSEFKEWIEKENKVLEVRSPDLLEISVVEIPNSVIRGQEYNLSAYANNTGTFTSHDVWLNYTLPNGWTNSSGNLSEYNDTLCSGCLLWNNMTANVSLSATLGYNEVRLDSASQEGQEDWDIETVYVWANTSLIDFQVSDSTPNREETIQLQVKLVYDNGSSIMNQNVSFYDEREDKFIDWNLTDSSGVATVSYTIASDAPLGNHVLNATYTGNSSVYTHSSYNTTTIDVGALPTITDVEAIPENQGYGYNVTIRANVTDEDGVDTVIAKVVYPNGTQTNLEMENNTPDIYEVNFTDTWIHGKHNYTVWANDTFGNYYETQTYNFYVKVKGQVLIKTVNDSYAPDNDVNLTVYEDEWWNFGWRYKKEINITENSNSNLTDYQILITLNQSNFNYSRANSDGSDIRFTLLNETNGNEQKIPYWIESWNTSGNSDIWVKVPYIAANDNTTIYLYYGNDQAESESNQTSVFSYTTPQTIYYVLSDRADNQNLNITSYHDGNNVTIGSNSQIINKQEVKTFSSVSQWDMINITYPIEGKPLVDTTDTIAPISFAGKKFGYPVSRDSDVWNVYSPFDDANVTIYNYTSTGTLSSVQSFYIKKGENQSINYNVSRFGIVESNVSVLIEYRAGAGDSEVLYPASTDLYGISSGNSYIGILEDNTVVDIYRSDGTHSQYTKDRGSYVTVGSGGSQGMGAAIHIVSNKPVVVTSQADSDGSESMAFWDQKELNKEYILPTNAQYLSVACPESNVFVYVYNSDGSLNSSINCGTNQKPYPNKAYFGTASNINYFKPGTKINSTEEFFVYYEYNTEDETNLLGIKQARKFIDPEPTYSFGEEKNYSASLIANRWETDFKGYLLMLVQKYDNGNWQTISVRINDTATGTPRNISAGSALDIASIWNSNPWNTDQQEAGTYRVYAAFTDEKGNVLNSEIGYIEGSYNFTVTLPPVQLNITEIRVYNVTDNLNPHIYTGDLEGSGINTTFTLYTGETYRVEITVENLPGGDTWYINNSNMSHMNLNSIWEIDSTNDIWYSNISDRSDTSFTGGTWSDGNVKWNSSLGGVVQPGGNATFYYIFNVSSSEKEDRSVVFKIEDPTFIKEDYSTYNILVAESVPPFLYQGIYNTTKVNVTRGESLVVYARWNETISEGKAEYNSTLSTLVNYTIDLPSPNPQNWTNYTIDTTSVWILGDHVVKIYASDEQGNWNGTLPYLTFKVWGMAEVTDGYMNASIIDVGDTVLITCEVKDSTNDEAIQDYVVHFFNSTHEIGVVQTNSSGWATHSYKDNSPGTETIVCNITENASTNYKVNENNYKNFILTTKEYEEPKYWYVSSNVTLAHKTDWVELRTKWTDNHQLDKALLATNASGWQNVSWMQLSGTESWANFTHQISSTMEPGFLAWKQYANDSFDNQNVTPEQIIEVWGWSEVSESYLTDSTIYVGNTTTMMCRISDANSSQGIANYPVSFYNSTHELGVNYTNATGWAQYDYTDYTTGQETIICNITDNSTLMYNITQDYEGSDVLTTATEGEDITPPFLMDETYGLNDTSVLKGDSILVYAHWNETIDNATVEYNSTNSSLYTYIIQSPYTGNWTNYTIETGNSWITGVHVVKIRASDPYDNWNETLSYLNFEVWGRAGVYWQSPTGTVDRGVIRLTCLVKDMDSNEPIEGYTVSFYNSTVSDTDVYFIGNNVTNSSGIAILDWNASNVEVGPEKLTCSIISNSDKYYYAIDNSDSTILTIMGRLNTTIISPQNQSVFHKTETTWLNSSTVDENDQQVTPTVTWYNSTHQIASGENTTWQIPAGHSVGEELIRADSTKQYYHSDSKNITVYIWGWSNVTWISPDDGSYQQNQDVELVCLVRDVNSSQGIPNYPVNFYNDTTFIGTNFTDNDGYASYTWNTDSLIGTISLKCNITDNSTLYYNASSEYEDNTTIAIDTIPPILENETRWHAENINYNETINISVDVTDDHLDEVWVGLYRPGSGDYINVTMNNVSVTRFNLTSDDYSYEVGRWNATFYANDTAGNENVSSVTLNWTVWGWSNISWTSPTDGSYSSGAQIVLVCNVSDSNTTSPIENYPVNFYNVSNSGSSLIGIGYSNSSGYANVTWDTSSLPGGTYYPTCNISDNSTLYYNVSEFYEANTTIVIENIPPQWDIWDLNATEIHRGEAVLAYSHWDETLSWGKAEHNGTGYFHNYTISYIYENWANYTLDTSNYTEFNNTGVINVSIYVADSAGNENVTTPAKNFIIWGWSNISWTSPDDGTYNQGLTIDLVCQVMDTNTSETVENYIVHFYIENSTNSIYLGTNLTNTTGHASYSWDTSTYTQGIYYPKCNITDNSTLYYNISEVYEANTTINITIPPGKLEVELIIPVDNTQVGQNRTFTVNATVYCRNGDCGNVQGTVRYNESSSNPDTAIPTSYDPTKPFYTMDAVNPKNCPTNPLEEDEFCNITWSINSTGDLHTFWEIGVLFDGTSASSNHTDNATVEIAIVLIMNLSENVINTWIDPQTQNPVSSLPPNTTGAEADNNPIIVSIDENSNDASGLYIKGTDLTNISYYIAVGNLTWNRVNTYSTGYRLSHNYDEIISPAPSGTNQNVYFWIDIPLGIAAQKYNGTVYIMANASS